MLSSESLSWLRPIPSAIDRWLRAQPAKCPCAEPSPGSSMRSFLLPGGASIQVHSARHEQARRTGYAHELTSSRRRRRRRRLLARFKIQPNKTIDANRWLAYLMARSRAHLAARLARPARLSVARQPDSYQAVCRHLAIQNGASQSSEPSSYSIYPSTKARNSPRTQRGRAHSLFFAVEPSNSGIIRPPRGLRSSLSWQAERQS